MDIDADPTEQPDACIGDEAGILRQLGVTACDQGVGKRNAETPGKMVIAGSRGP
jgi:hypothetical protein